MMQVHLSYPSPGVALILLDNPPRNFGTWALLNRLEERLTEADAAGARVVVLASAVPGYFLAHASLADIVATFDGGTPSGDGRSWRRVLETLARGPMISIAANNGQAWGGGSELSWSCNLRLAAASATYGQPEVWLGIIPGAGGTTRLARLVGPTKCMEMILTGEPISATQALRLGAVNRVVPDHRLRAEALALATRLASAPPEALRAAKRSLVEGLDLPLPEAIRNEGRIFGEVAGTPEALRIMRAAQVRYDAGEDSYAVLGVQPPPDPTG